jgi:predicted MPP superfamily phosphohydrolase
MDFEFRGRTHYPGSQENYFGKFVDLLDKVENVPSVIFASVLVLLAFIASGFSWNAKLVILLFYIGDWVVLSYLPKARISYGPAKPQVFVLAILRSFFILMPMPWFLTLQIIGTCLVVYGFWIEPSRVVVHREHLETAKLPPGPPIRILHIGDIHIDRISIREEKLISHLHRLQPDLILFSGDILSLSSLDDPQAHADARMVLAEFKAPLGAYMVGGSPPIDRDDILPILLEDLPLNLINNQRVKIVAGDREIEILGISCTHKPAVDGAMLQHIDPRCPSNLTILLYHSPDLAPIAAKEMIDLQLSGHTHGGQVRIPWYGALYASSLYGKRFEAGRSHLNGMVLYVTRGLGFEGKGAPRVRFLCPPEIVLWEITSVG